MLDNPNLEPLSESTDDKRSVRFQLIDLIEIAIVLGDNPSLSTGGPPMSLGWDQIRRSEFDLDHYETYRPTRKESRRQLIISGKKRTKFFLRCGYSLAEIEEAAAISLNYRKQMTITKLLDPPLVMKDAVKNRFASSHEAEDPTARHRISRRHSNDPLTNPHREPEYDHVDSSPLSMQSNLSGDALNPSKLRMQRRLSNFEPGNGLVRKLSNERLVAPTRTISPKQKRYERRNSPTAELEPPSSPLESMELPTPNNSTNDDSPLQLPSRSVSPKKGGRLLRRHHSAPLDPYQGLRAPVRTLSPIPASPTKKETQDSGVKTMEENSPDTLVVASTKQSDAPTFPNRAATPSPPPSPPPPDRPGRSPTNASPVKPRRRLSPPIQLQSEVIPSRRF